MLTRPNIKGAVAALVVVLPVLAPLLSTPAVRAGEGVKGVVIVSSTTVSPTNIKLSGSTCATATVQVAVARGTFTSDNPSVTLSLDKFSSDPANVEVEITPTLRQATIKDSTGNFTFEVCLPRQKGAAGTLTLKSTITNWSPKEKFDRKSEKLKYEVASITIEN